MISIVAHGIMGTAYRQDVVADEGVSENGSLQVLHDIRRQLSTQYGDDTPMTGWALQPAPSGMWLSHIERAFDANYAPGYVMVSFLIPQGKRLLPKAAQTIEHALVVNHAKFMQQSVVLHRPDWGFLHVLGRELEGMIEDVANVITYEWKEGNGAACFSGDISSLLTYSWDSRFRQYSIVYCGRQILSVDRECSMIEDTSSNSEKQNEDSSINTALCETDTFSTPSEGVNCGANTDNNELYNEMLSDEESNNEESVSPPESRWVSQPNCDNISANPTLFKRILFTLVAAVISLTVGFVAAVILDMLFFRTPYSIGMAVAILSLLAAIGLLSYGIGYVFFEKNRWQHKKIAIITGVSLMVLIVVCMIIPVEFLNKAAFCFVFLLFSALLSMLTYTLAYKVFKYSGLTRYKWVNLLCFVLTFIWCMIWCCGIGMLFVIPD